MRVEAKAADFEIRAAGIERVGDRRRALRTEVP
jgi:hypothetical protein